MKLKLFFVLILFSLNCFAGDHLQHYKRNYESKRKQFQKSVTSSEMQKNVDDWNKFTEDELSQFLKSNEKNGTISDLHKKWLDLRDSYWSVLDKKYKTAPGSIATIDHVRAKLEFTSNHLQSLMVLLD